MNKWAALLVCAVAAAAVGIFAIWAFGIRDSGATAFVTVNGSGNPAEDEWAAQICTAVANWERPWVKTVFAPINRRYRRKRVPVATTIERMQVLTNRLRTDIDRIVPPTDRMRKWQRYFAKTARGYAEKFGKLEPDRFSKVKDVVSPWGDISGDVTSFANLASPHLGVLFAEAKACDEVDRYSLTGKPWP